MIKIKKIQSIKKLEEKQTCYDICLLEKDTYINESNFIAEGFIVHNSGMANAYTERRNGKKDYKTHEILDKIIGDTQYVIIYQEQLLKIMNVIGNISLQDCEMIRKAMAKKREKEFIKYKEIFIENGQKTLEWSKQEIEELWNQMITFADYGFNKSHSVAYTMISSRCLYLKTHYPEEYFAAVLTHLKTGDERIKKYIQEGEKKGLVFIPLDINKSKTGFIPTENGIIIGFDKIKGIKKEAIELINLQPFHSFEDYLERYGLSKITAEILIKANAFKNFENNIKILLEYFNYRRSIKESDCGMGKNDFGKMFKEIKGLKSCPKNIYEQFLQLCDNKSKIKYNILLDFIKNNKFDFTEIDKNTILEYIEKHKNIFNLSIMTLEEFKKQQHIQEISDFSYEEKCEFEEKLYSFYFNHPIENYQIEGKQISDVIENDLGGIIEGIIKDIVKKKTKNDNSYYILTIEDKYDQIKVLLWSNQYNKYKDIIYKQSAIRLKIKKSPYSAYNLSDDENIKRIRKKDELSEKKEKEIKLKEEFEKLLIDLDNK